MHDIFGLKTVRPKRGDILELKERKENKKIPFEPIIEDALLEDSLMV